MPMQPITAIITRTRNRTLLLERAIKSIVSQTSQDYVHVIVNDGGDIQAVEEVLKKYPDEKRLVIHNKESVGLVSALNQGIRSTRSEYIAILDDDDTWHPERVEKVHDFLKNTGAPGVAVYMDRIIEKVERDAIVELTRNRWHEGVDNISLYDQCLDNYLSNGCFTFRRKAYDSLGGYDETLKVAEDWDFGLKFLLKYDVDFLPGEVLTYYHHRPDQTGDTGNSVFAGIDQHKRALNQLRNRYLREDLNRGKVGVGYLMNQLAAERATELRGDEKASERVVRLEGHMNYIAKQISQDIHTNTLKVMSSTVIHQVKRILKKNKNER